MSATKALLFDLDDTLYDAEAAYTFALQSIELLLDKKAYLDGRRFAKSLLSEGSPAARNRVIYIKNALELENRFSAQLTLNIYDTYEIALLEFIRSNIQTSGVIELLACLVRRYKLFLITNETTRIQLLKLNEIDPKGEFFSRILTSEEVGVEKPKSEIFHAMLAMTELDPSQVCMIGDSVNNDIEPATKLGMNAILFTQYHKETQKYGGTSANSYEELARLLVSHGNGTALAY